MIPGARFNLPSGSILVRLLYPGAYYIQAEGIKSPVFRISKDVYDGTADFLLKYMRQQRCGYNPFLHDSCHTRDGYMIYGSC